MAKAKIRNKKGLGPDVPGYWDKRFQLNVTLPEYLWRALKQASLREKRSLRFYVLSGLAASGFSVAEEDLSSDQRRTRPKRRHYASRTRSKPG